MQKIARPRRYVSPLKLYAMLPALRYSYERGAYVLRFVGENHGPVLRKDRRSARPGYSGPERRLATDGSTVDPARTSRPSGGVRVVPKAAATAPAGSKTRASSKTRTGSDGRSGSNGRTGSNGRSGSNAPAESNGPTGSGRPGRSSSNAPAESSGPAASGRPEATRRRPQHGRQRPPRPRH